MFVLILSLYVLWVIGYLIWERKKIKKAPPEDSLIAPIEEVSTDEIMGKSTFRLGMNEIEVSQEKEEIQTVSLDSLNQAFQNFTMENEPEHHEPEPENEPEEKNNLTYELRHEPEEEEEEYYQSCTFIESPSTSSDLTIENINKAFRVVVNPDSSSPEEKTEAVKLISEYEKSDLFQQVFKDRSEAVSNLLNQHLTDYYKSSNSSTQRG